MKVPALSSSASIGPCGIEITPSGSSRRRRWPLQLDLVELKFGGDAKGEGAAHASIGPCGIEIADTGQRAAEYAALQLDLVELK